MHRLLASSAIMLLAGCNLYFGGGDDEPPHCYAYGEDYGASQPYQLRNPYTGECESFGGGGPYPCDDRCGPCPATGQDAPAYPNWAQCYTQCDNLDENSCSATPGCQAAYESKDGVMTDPADPTGPGRGQAFMGCWATAPIYGDPTLSCAQLDPEACSQRDFCAMNYTTTIEPDDGLYRYWSHCSAEGGTGDVCYSDMDCGDGERCTAGYEECNSGGMDGGSGPGVCAGHCVPKENSCSNIDCGPSATCEEHCYMGMNGQMVCEPVCVQNTTCAAVDCGPGYHCVETCTGGDPMDPNGPGCGSCYPQCVPDNTPTACSELPSEMACESRSDCRPVYLGEDCTCYPEGCYCNSLTYERCEGGGMRSPTMP